MDDQSRDKQQGTNDSTVPAGDENSVPPSSPSSSVRQRAIEALVPLLDNLKDAPERKFEIIMTAVRSSDDKNLLDKALSTAMQIEEPTARAEALLDLINEASFQEEQQRGKG